jgi:tetratricopeptide (TPR) repeat protein
MISSTALDLPEHREEIRLGCQRTGFEVRMMEHLPAADADAIKASLRMVDEADVYVGVFAYRYGYVPDGHDISITEMEYNHAVKKKKPRLIFFIHEDHPITGRDVETGPGTIKLQALKDRIAKERVATYFKSAKDLRAQLVEALTELNKELSSDENNANHATRAAVALHRATSIPTPPEPYIAHPYTLMQLRELVGRQAELNSLTNWIANRRPPLSPGPNRHPWSRPDPRSNAAFVAPIFCFVAIGGMGKSALASKWFNQIAPNEMKPLAGRMWWSFYESDATFENFLNRALCYVSGQSEEEVRLLPWQEREAQLLQYLNDKPYLIALDGLERILIAYNRMDASYLADDAYDQQTANWVTGAVGLPASAAQSFVGQHRLRDTTDPRVGTFLQKLAQTNKSRILMTTRLYPRALQLPTGDARPGSSAYFLRGLSDDDALGLWRALGVSGSRAELLPIFLSVENHPLLIQALASEVANYRKAPGDFAQWQADHPRFDPTSLPLVQSRTHILEFALRNLSANIREVLNTIVTFRMPASYVTLEALLVGADKACHSVQDLDRALTELEDRGLIGWDREANRYDAHPIVRGIVWQLMDVKDQRDIYESIASHFEPMGVPYYENVESLADLTPAIERYHTLISLGRYENAFTLFHDRLDRATLYRLAAYRERIGWLERLFPQGLDALPALSTQTYQYSSLNALAQSYLFSGQPLLAIPLFQKSIAIAERRHDDAAQRVGLCNVCSALAETGALRQAIGDARRAVILSRRQEDAFQEGVTLQIFGSLISRVGDRVLGQVAIARGARLFADQGSSQPKCVTTARLAECALWIGDVAKGRLWADLAWELAAVERLERDFIRAAILQGRIACYEGNLTRADERLHYALTRARTRNMLEFELQTQIAIAGLELHRGRLPEARCCLDDVWEPAEHGPYRLLRADAYNVLAAIAIAEGGQRAAIDAATEAYNAAWCDGAPYAYHWALQKAKAHLARLGAPEPDIPPFDERRYPPLVEVEINPKDEYWVDPDKLD